MLFGKFKVCRSSYFGDPIVRILFMVVVVFVVCGGNVDILDYQ